MTAQDLQRLELAREADTLRLHARVPRDLACFAGHFPGHPVLPGFLQVHWAMELAQRELGVSQPPSALEALKFRRLLLPGDEFVLRIERSGTGLVFGYEGSEDGEPSASGRLRLDAPVGQHTPEGAAAPTQASPLPLRIPQQGSMRLLDRVIAHVPPVTVCEAGIHEAMPLCSDGRVPAWLALELLAQGMAAQGALAAVELSPDRRAFLVGARRVELRTRSFAVGERLWVRVRHVRGETGFVVSDCALGTGPAPGSGEEASKRALAQGALMAYVEPLGGESATG